MPRISHIVFVFFVGVTCLGCLGISGAQTSGSAAVTAMEITIPEGVQTDPGGSNRPTVQTTESAVIVTGEIAGVDDSACIEIMGNATIHSNGTLITHIQSQMDPPANRGCNMTSTDWPYRATIAINGSMPDRIQITYIDSNGSPRGDWMISLSEATERLEIQPRRR